MDDDSHVETRVCQYEAVKNRKGIYVAKQFVLSKIEGQNRVLAKHDLEVLDPVYRGRIELMKPESLGVARRRLIPIEASCSRIYFKQISRLFPEGLKPESRVTFQAYDGMNNTFNLAYEVLSWKVHRALIKAKLEPFLGFLHSTAFSKPSLVCDFQELYRYLIDDFLIQSCQMLRKKDFIVKT